LKSVIAMLSLLEGSCVGLGEQLGGLEGGRF
jgi:hypothetical protein